MERTLTEGRLRWPRLLSFFSGIGMMAAAFLTIRHFFAANYPESIFEGSFCDISAFFNCDGSAFSPISQLMGIPIGFFGLITGGLVVLGTFFPSEKFERTNTFISLVNILGVAGLVLYSVLSLGSLCLLCTGYYVFSAVSFALFWAFGAGRKRPGGIVRWFRPSIRILLVTGLVAALAGVGMIDLHEARKEARAAVSLRIVKEFFELPVVGNPGFISPYWTVRSTEMFEDAPIQVVLYSDFLCPDCLFLNQQLTGLKEEFAGRINIAFQFFPLEGRCNSVVDKDIHPGACELAWMAAFDPALFLPIHDEIFAHFNSARDPQWRRETARRYGIEQAFEDPATMGMVRTITDTGAGYDQTSDRYAHGIRSTPTMIINGRMVIGTLPDQQLRAVFQALVDEAEGESRFIENWVPAKARRAGR